MKVFAMCLACLGAGSICLVASAAAAPRRTVLTIYAQAREAAAINAFDQSLRNTLAAVSGDSVSCFAEFIDSQRFSGDRFVDAFRDYLTKKYEGRSIDALVLVGPAAARAVVDRQPLFPGVPTVFYTIDRSDIAAPAGAAGLVGTFGRDQQRSLALALALHPGTQQVFVVVQATPEDPPYERDVRRALAAFEGRVAIRYLTDLPTAGVIAALNAAPARSIVLYVQQSVATPGGRSDPRDALAQIADAVNLPIYGGLESYLGAGVVGGYLYSGAANGAGAARLAWRMVNGERPAGTIENDAAVPIFDARRLTRWQIPEDRLPAGSVIRFREPSFWTRYRPYAIGTLAIVALQSGLIAMLVAQRRRRRHAEHALRGSEARYREVVEAQTDLICRFLPDTTLTFVNEEYARFLKKPVGELIGARLLDLVPAARRDAFAQHIAALLESPGSRRYESKAMRDDGSVGCWIEWVNSTRLGPDGRVAELIGTGRDITDRKRAEESLRQSEERNGAILRAMPDLLFVMNRDGVYLDYHARDPRDLFIPPEQFLGKSVFDIMTPELSTIFAGAIARADASGEPAVVQYALPMPGGERFFEARIVRSESGQVVSIVRDITEQTRAAARLRLSEDRYALATSAGGVGVWDWSVDSDHVYVDPVVLRILDRPDPGPGRGLDWRTLVHPGDHDLARNAGAAYVEGRSDRYDVELRMPHRDGSVRWFHTLGSAIRGDDGRVYRMIGTFTDVTDRKRAEQALLDREASLRASYAQIQDLAGRLILEQETERMRLARELHDDLSQRVSLISIDLDQLRLEAGAGDVAGQMQAIAARAAGIATDVHRLSHRLHPYNLAMLGLVSAIRRMCDEMAARFDIPIEFVHDGVPAGLAPDVSLCLFRIVQEGLHNVVKHSRATRASVQLSNISEALSLTIEDAGVGFVPGMHERTGLGLVSMRERAIMLGGQFTIHSAPGSGTRIGVEVPLVLVMAGNSEPVASRRT